MSSNHNDRAANWSFFAMVGGMMALLKAKERWDDYQQVSQEEGRRNSEEGPRPRELGYRDTEDGQGEEAISLLDTQLPRKPRRKRTSCCVCCGINCSIFWKAFGIVLGLTVLWYGIKLVWGVLTPSPIGLEGLPVFSESLGCASAKYVYNSSLVTVTAPVSSTFDHSFDIRGSGVGTILLVEGEEDATEVVYDMTIRSDSEDLIEKVLTPQPHYEEDGSIINSHLRLITPTWPNNRDACMRFDVVMHIPPNLKDIHLASHSPRTHIKFDENARVKLSSMKVTLFGMNYDNMILPNFNVQANTLRMEVYEGWIVGDVSVVDTTKIITQRGQAVTNLKVYPIDSTSTDTSSLRTVTGQGRTDITYMGSENRRPIRSDHISSSPNSELYLTYSGAGFDGRLEVDASNFAANNIQRLEDGDSFPGKTPDTVKSKKWTHYVGSTDGRDELRVQSRGWIRLYF